MTKRNVSKTQQLRHGTAQVAARALTEWIHRRCRVQALTGMPLDRARPSRTSSASVTLFKASATTSFAAADRTDPDVAEALALGFDVVRRDAIGETTRAELGDRVFVLQMRHAPGGKGKKQLGVVLHIGRTFFVYLLASARASNLEADTDDRRGNAATELLSMVVRGMTAVGRELDTGYRPHVYAREHARIVRDEQHGAALKSTFTACRVIAHVPQTIDLTKPTEANHFSFGSMLSAASADANILGMNRSEIVIQANGGFNEDIRRVPFTHGPLVRHETDHRTGVVVVTTDKHRIACTPDLASARQQLRRLVDTVLEDRHNGGRAEPATDWFAVGDLMAEFDLPCRLPKYLKRDIRLRSLPRETRAKAAKSFFSERWIAGWRDGQFVHDVPAKIAMDLDLSDLGVEQLITPEGKTFYRCIIEMPVPEGGWGVSHDEWAEVLRRRYPTSTKPRVYTGMVLPLAGTPEWDDSDDTRPATQQFDVFTSTSRYLLRSRPFHEAGNPDGSQRGWTGSTITHCGGMRAAEFHADLARSMREALLTLDCATEPVVLTPAHAIGGPVGNGAGPEAAGLRRAELEEALERAQLQRRGAVDARNEAAGMHAVKGTEESAEELEEAEEDLARAKARVRQLNKELSALSQTPAAPVTSAPHIATVAVETATAEFVAAALEKCEGAAPGWLQEACQVLLADVRLSPSQDPGQRPKMRWSATLTLTTIDAAGNAERVGLPLSGEVINRSHARDGKPALNGPEAWAWAYFYRGDDFSTIGMDADIDGSGKKNSFLYKGLYEWVGAGTWDTVPDVHLRTAALDCPIPETRRVLWSAITGDESALNGIDKGFSQHIRQTYTNASSGLWWGWCKDTHQLSRSAAHLMLAHGGNAALFSMAQQLNVSPVVITALARVNGKAIKRGAAARPAPTARSPFTKNWTRGANCLPPEERRLALRPCPHRDCPKRLQGGQPYASHVLLVPETGIGFGVLCPDCCRLPVLGMTEVRFPENYLRPWSGRFGRGSHAGARAYPGTHLDPTIPDPGPSEQLPDTGTQPRTETVLNKPGNHLAKHLQGLPLGGQRILPLDLSPADHDVVASQADRLGGRLAVKVTKSLEYMVVTDARATRHPRALRAAEQGTEVLTVSQFRTRARGDWADQKRNDAA